MNQVNMNLMLMSGSRDIFASLYTQTLKGVRKLKYILYIYIISNSYNIIIRYSIQPI